MSFDDLVVPTIPANRSAALICLKLAACERAGGDINSFDGDLIAAELSGNDQPKV